MKIARRRSSNPEISLVSTSDVAFLLLIFFLSTAALNVERGLLLDLPRAGDVPAEIAASRLVTVEVAADGAFSLDGKPVTQEELRAGLSSRVVAAPDAVVRLLVASAAPYRAFVTALDQVKLSGARELSLETGAGA
ncbi:MAG TPA: biopolymer transporter ExbD [Candidatus Eisenbacteria bacterium]|nr:biopolymer transporter ExbD [Candidatus Eisenbacteria bacterium]